MKKLICAVTIGLCGLSLTGCVDIVQHITRRSDGTDQNTISITVVKSVLEMIAAMKEIDSLNYEDFFDAFDTSDIEDYKQFNAKITSLNDQFSFGFLIDMNIDYKDKNTLKAVNTEHIVFIPQYEKKKMTIYTDSLQDEDFSQTDDEMALLFLASGKYRLLISKSCIPSISKILLKTAKSSTEVGYLDLYDEYLIEIPMMLLLKDKLAIEIYH